MGTYRRPRAKSTAEPLFGPFIPTALNLLVSWNIVTHLDSQSIPPFSQTKPFNPFILRDTV